MHPEFVRQGCQCPKRAIQSLGAEAGADQKKQEFVLADVQLPAQFTAYGLSLLFCGAPSVRINARGRRCVRPGGVP